MYWLRPQTDGDSSINIVHKLNIYSTVLVKTSDRWRFLDKYCTETKPTVLNLTTHRWTTYIDI